MLGRMKEDTLRLADGTLDYAAFGRGTRPLVIIPGLSLRDVKGAGAGLAWMYRRFAKDYRVYVLDKKSNISAGYTVRDIANDTAEVNIVPRNIFIIGTATATTIVFKHHL